MSAVSFSDRSDKGGETDLVSRESSLSLESSKSEDADCGDMIRTVLPVLLLLVCKTPASLQLAHALEGTLKCYQYRWEEVD